VITACDDHAARIFDTATGALVATLPHPDRVMAGAWSRDGARIVTSGWDGKLRVWDSASAALVLAIDDGAVGLLDATFSPDGRRIASGGHGGELDVWNAITGAHELSLVGHAGPTTSATWSPDGELIASTSSDSSWRMWDARSGKQLAQRHGDGELMQAVWSRDGTRIYTISTGGTFATWYVGRDARSLAELADLLARRVPYRLVDGQLELVAR
jgi:WD40 repeat protein